MNSDVKNVLYYRQKLVHNLDRIIGAAKKEKSNAGQLSLFGEEDKAEVILDEPEDFNPFAAAEKERDMIGFNLTYSPFDEFETIRCRYCNSQMTKVKEVGEDANCTMLVRVRDIEYRTSQFGNKYAKVVFGDETGEERLYVMGDLYKQRITELQVNAIYLLTVKFNEEKQVMDIVNFTRADTIKPKISTMWIQCTSHQLPTVRMYLKCFLMGNEYGVNLRVEDFNKTMFDVGRVSIDNDNLVEMRKQNIIVKLR